MSAAILLTAVTAATAQRRDLPQDVANLDIRRRTPHYAIAGTVSDDRLAEYGRALEYIYDEYAKGFGELLTDDHQSHDTDRRFRVVILAKQAEYQQFTRAYFAGGAEHTRGLFVPGADLLVIQHDPDAEETDEVLFHEAFHQFVDRYLPLAPVWVNEGLATYYGTARPTPHGLVFDRPRGDFFRVVSAAIDARQLIPFSDLMTEDAGAFYGRQKIEGLSFDRTTLAYAQSYTFVFYLLQNKPTRNHLCDYLRTIARDTSADEVRTATNRAFPPDHLGPLVDDWLATVHRH